MSNNTKNNMLAKIRAALQEKTPKPFPELKKTPEVYTVPEEDDLLVVFAEELNKVKGHFVYCESPKELVLNLEELTEKKGWRHLYCWDTELQDFLGKVDFRACRIGKNLEKSEGGITTCEALIARTGSVLVSSAQAAGRTLSIFPPVHSVIATADQLVYNIKDAMDMMKDHYGDELPSMLSIETGPSRTADIEKTLILGAHGPKELYVFLLEE